MKFTKIAAALVFTVSATASAVSQTVEDENFIFSETSPIVCGVTKQTTDARKLIMDGGTPDEKGAHIFKLENNAADVGDSTRIRIKAYGSHPAIRTNSKFDVFITKKGEGFTNTPQYTAPQPPYPTEQLVTGKLDWNQDYSIQPRTATPISAIKGGQKVSVTLTISVDCPTLN